MHAPEDLLVLHTHAECCGTTAQTLQDCLDFCLEENNHCATWLPRPLLAARVSEHVLANLGDISVLDVCELS